MVQKTVWKQETVGKSEAGREIRQWSTGEGSLRILVLGGVHGDESEGFLFADRMIQEAEKGNFQIPDGISLYVIPRMNPDGCENLRRTNQHNVDLNRNLPTADWTGEFQNVRYYPGASGGSEVESRLTVERIRILDPALIVSLHSYEKPMINFNGDCEDLAKDISVANGLPPKGDIGYPTPGSLGTWAGWERNLPTITLEILRGQEPEGVWKDHREGMERALRFYLNHPLPPRKKEN